MKKLKQFGLRAFQIIGSFIFFMNALAGVANGLAGKTSAADCWIPLGVGIGGLFIIYLSRTTVQQTFSARHQVWQEKVATSLAQVIAIHLLVWVALTGAVAAFAFFSIFNHDMLPLRQFAAKGVQTQGRVVAKGGKAATLVHYTFSVNGKTYKNAGQSGLGMPALEELKVNDKVPVFYIPSNPQNSMLGNPKSALESERVFIIIMPFFFSAFLMIQLMWCGSLPRYK